jgi:L-threonylcarbamoyladenylate synthase
MQSVLLRRAAGLLAEGGVIAYPTEGVFGLGCLPHFGDAVEHILAIKGRSAKAGLILVAADYSLLSDWIAPTPAEHARLDSQSSSSAEHAITWIVSAHRYTPEWLTGGRKTVAVRISKHPVAAALSRAAGSALVSTSANRSGRPAAMSTLAVRKIFANQLDMVVPGALGGASGPSEIRVAQDDRVIRTAS